MAILGLPSLPKRGSKPTPQEEVPHRSEESSRSTPHRFKAPEHDVNRVIDELPGLKRHQREYLRAKLEIGHPGRESHLTRDDFRRIVREMEQDSRDPIWKEHAKKLRAKENELFGGA